MHRHKATNLGPSALTIEICTCGMVRAINRIAGLLVRGPWRANEVLEHFQPLTAERKPLPPMRVQGFPTAE